MYTLISFHSDEPSSTTFTLYAVDPAVCSCP